MRFFFWGYCERGRGAGPSHPCHQNVILAANWKVHAPTPCGCIVSSTPSARPSQRRSIATCHSSGPTPPKGRSGVGRVVDDLREDVRSEHLGVAAEALRDLDE